MNCTGLSWKVITGSPCEIGPSRSRLLVPCRVITASEPQESSHALWLGTCLISWGRREHLTPEVDAEAGGQRACRGETSVKGEEVGQGWAGDADGQSLFQPKGGASERSLPTGHDPPWAEISRSFLAQRDLRLT